MLILLFLKSFLFNYINKWKSNNEEIDTARKSILVFYPHTSIYDALALFTLKFKYNIQFYWLTKKDQIYNKIYSPILRLFMKNYIIVDDIRKKSSINTLKNKIDKFIFIAPEGTRKYTEYWKTGFYYLSLNTGLPIIFNYPNFNTKTVYHSEPIYSKDYTIKEVIDYAKKFYGQFDIKNENPYPDKIGKIELKN